MHAKQILQKKRSLKDLFSKVYVMNFTKKQTENSRKTVEIAIHSKIEFFISITPNLT